MAGLAATTQRKRSRVGLVSLPQALFNPRPVFSRVEDVTTWRWPLVLLLTGVTLVGYAKVQTGLIDLEVRRATWENIARIDRQQRDVVERSALRELYQAEFKKAEFTRLLTRIQVIVAEPGRLLATVLLTSAILFGVVALTGRKPEWNTLLTICTFAAFVELLRLLVQLGLMLSYRTLDVDTSPALLIRLMDDWEGSRQALGALAGLLRSLDPFRLWFWYLVIAGLSATAQLPGWRAWLTCGLCWLVVAGVRAGLGAGAVMAQGA